MEEEEGKRRRRVSAVDWRVRSLFFLRLRRRERRNETGEGEKECERVWETEVGDDDHGDGVIRRNDVSFQHERCHTDTPRAWGTMTRVRHEQGEKPPPSSPSTNSATRNKRFPRSRATNAASNSAPQRVRRTA